MKLKILIALAVLGIIAGLISAKIYSSAPKPPSPVYITKNPFKNGVYANGIIEPVQSSGASVNVYPEVSGEITKVFVKKGQPLFEIDNKVQEQAVKQLYHQMKADQITYEELKNEPRKENLEIAKKQVSYAKAQEELQKSVYEKLLNSYKLNPKSVSKQDLDNAKYQFKVAKKNLELAIANYNLVKAGAWSYDINAAYQRYMADKYAYKEALELLHRYTVKAPSDGEVLELNVAVGDYASPNGVYNTYTRGYSVPVRLGAKTDELQVRAFIDEILLAKLPPIKDLKGIMFIRGTNISIPLKFVAVEPYVTPKIELSNETTERVDVRVLPVIFRFKKPKDVNIYPGQLVDIYLEGK